MHFRIPVLMAFVVVLSFEQASGQTVADQIVNEIMEDLGAEAPEDYDFGDLTERLHQYLRNPLNINRASREQLEDLLFLNQLQINALLKHRTENGNFIDLLELQTVDAFDLTTIRKLLPFIAISSENSLSGLKLSKLKQGNNDLIVRYGQILEQQKGYSKSAEGGTHYLGSPQKLLLRYRYNSGKNLLIALNMEKDAGEQFFSGTQSMGFDLYSGSVQFKQVGRVEKIVAGDYGLQFGQGLALWSGLGFSKGADLAGFAKQDFGLRQNSSFNESMFLRGLSGTVRIKKFSLTPFVSYKTVDATVEGEGDRAEVTALSVTGYHRTTTELDHRSSVRQLVTGGALQFKTKSGNIGLTAYHTALDKPVAPDDALYKQFDFSGDQLTNLGINYNYSYRNIYLFGEAAHSLHSGFAYLNGAIASLSPRISAAVLQRDYDRNYHSFFSQAISENTNSVNEKALYTGLVFKPFSGWEVSSYLDAFKFPWLKFGVDAPSRGYEALNQVTYAPSKKIKITGRFRIESKEENSSDEVTIKRLEAVVRRNYRLELFMKMNDDFQVRTRTEISRYRKGTEPSETGQMIFQDIIYNPLDSKFSGNVRFGLFDISSADSRIYAFENDVLYSYSMISYQQRGFRFYVNGRYRLRRGIDIWIRYARIAYPELTEVGTGLDEIKGNKKSDVKLQVRYQF